MDARAWPWPSSFGLRPSVVVPRGDVADGIQAVRSMMPRFLFDAEKCYEGLEALKAYRRAWNETRKDWADHPQHDFASHASDALRTFAMGYQETTPRSGRLARPPGRRGRACA